MRLPYNHNLIPLAKSLRKHATPQENHLWFDFLRSFPVRFQRQKAIGPYIADFYCEKAKLVVELDGIQHYAPDQMQHDALRTTVLEERHIQVLRFTNRDVDTHFPGVCQVIQETVSARIDQQKEGSP